MIIVKIVISLIISLFLFCIVLWIVVENHHINYMRKYGKRIKAKITGKKIISNKNCNGLPGYHYKIILSWQAKEDIVDDSYLPIWRYLTKSRAEKISDKFEEGKYIEIYKDRDEEDSCMPVMVNKSRLIYPCSLAVLSLSVIIFIWSL